MDLQNQRNDYNRDQLLEANLPSEPLHLFNEWVSLAMDYNVYDANAMVLSTCLENKPSSRIVLLKGFDRLGFVFYTNYSSRKGHELELNPNAALNFYWRELEKQIRIEGKVEKTTREESEQYFNSRPLESRIGAIVSEQSKELSSRILLENKMNKLLQSPAKISKPDDWGGYRLIPETIEFWQGRANRLHDRIQYFLKDGKWSFRRLYP